MKETGNIPIIPVIHVPALLRQNIEPAMSSHAVCKKSYFFGPGLRVQVADDESRARPLQKPRSREI